MHCSLPVWAAKIMTAVRKRFVREEKFLSGDNMKTEEIDGKMAIFIDMPG
jgi:hypothetical protein